MSTGADLPGGEAEGHEADHSPLSSAEVKNCSAILSRHTPLFLMILHTDFFIHIIYLPTKLDMF
jgi:hypothetical protein